jgi:hypothetical protein
MILPLCLGILGCFILSGTIGIFAKTMAAHHHPPLAVVDMQALVTRQSQQLAQTRKGKVSPRHIQQISERLKATLDAFATRHRLILLTKGALAGGESALPDYTLDIVMLLEEGKQEQEGQEAHRQEGQQQKQHHNHDQQHPQEAVHHGLF